MNGDGCNSNCRIEEGWSCSEGSPTKKDICFYTIPPKITLKYITNENYLVISFSEPILVDEGDLSSDDLLITIKRQNSYDVDFNWKSAITSEFY